jgi:hypothetical protein
MTAAAPSGLLPRFNLFSGQAPAALPQSHAPVTINFAQGTATIVASLSSPAEQSPAEKATALLLTHFTEAFASMEKVINNLNDKVDRHHAEAVANQPKDNTMVDALYVCVLASCESFH